MIVATLDVESSGTGPEDQVVEIGIVVRDLSCSTSPVKRWSTLVKPTVPVHPAARGAHHITDVELSKAPTIQKVIGVLKKHFVNVHALVGHNLAFDVRMLTQSGVAAEMLPVARICTWRCARHLWPDAPSFGNQALRYWKELDVRPNGSPHRALPDAVVTDALLMHMLRSTCAEKLIELTELPILQTKIAFGKFRGKLWSEVDLDYCQWILHPKRQPPFDEEVRYTAKHWLKILQERKKNANGNIKDQGPGGKNLPVRQGEIRHLPEAKEKPESAVDQG